MALKLITVITLFLDPMKWSPSQVQTWLSWAIKEFHLENVERENFYVDGRALCAMSQQEFLSRTPQFMGDILYAHIQHLRSGESISPFTAKCDAWLIRVFVC